MNVYDSYLKTERLPVFMRAALGQWFPTPLAAVVILLLGVLFVFLAGGLALAQEPGLPAGAPVPGTLEEAADANKDTVTRPEVDVDALINKAAGAAAAQQQFELRYRFPKGALLRWQVEHTATT